MSKAIRIHGYGGPEVCSYDDIETGSPGEGQVRLRHTAIGVNYLDIYHRSGAHTLDALPAIIGMEGAGVVEKVGPGVSGFNVGDRVCYHAALGSYCQQRLMTADRLINLPDDIDDKVSASMMMKGLTSEYLIRRCYPVQAGDNVMLRSAAGGVGTIMSQWLKHLGATVIGTVGRDEKAAIAEANGCDHVIVSTTDPVAQQVRELTAGEGVAVNADGNVVYGEAYKNELLDPIISVARVTDVSPLTLAPLAGSHHMGGASGGAIINQAGELIGVLSGSGWSANQEGVDYWIRGATVEAFEEELSKAP